MIRAALDTSVLVPRSYREALQIAAQDGLYVALWSPWIIAELHRVLTWRWVERTHGDISLANQQACGRAAKTMMRILMPTFQLVDVRLPSPPAWIGLTDMDDVPVWATAVVGNATHVVSENSHDYPPLSPDGRNVYHGVEYLSAARFLAILYGEGALV